MNPIPWQRPVPMLCGLTAATLLVAAPLAAQAETFPSKPVNFVVPFPPGGPTDAMARTLAVALTEALGQSVIVENKSGAGGNIGADMVARAKPDGYTIMFGTSGPLAINQSLYTKISYDPATSFAPIIRVGHLPNILVVHPKLHASTVQQLIAQDKAKPASLNYASSGNGASSHLAGVLFNQKAGTQLQHVPYKGTGPALNDLLAGQVDMTFTDILTAMPYIQSGKLKAIGVTTDKRSQAMPQIPTIAEQGLPGYDVSVFFGVVAPKGTPADRIATLNQAFRKALASDKVRSVFAAQGLEPAPDHSPQALGRFISEEVGKWKTVVDASGAKLD
ncbi:tripartite tricarboxylate transporter substrate binding protein [Comamonas terrigena]|uniref:Tripartite tricarboxylate transporter substrate binding protein n=2 Tax=Comamonadaceae TaxID=80864 RepID=A0A2A7UU36_COMTR|nr:tripartite tricarboxylate transporter substrate binding protein [Comamonas terrigena]PEH88744.1 tripartite tricarboxylate transporter substrate binding protein [Comamonas terrigena]BBL23782.1 MFS transporter [Comamonas terrigena NBRC 13299]SUY88443.1 Argininosuccinate lyase [Comamonas terrigena]